MELRYIRDTDKREVDFVVLKEGKPEFAVECKLGEKAISHTCSLGIGFLRGSNGHEVGLRLRVCYIYSPGTAALFFVVRGSDLTGYRHRRTCCSHR